MRIISGSLKGRNINFLRNLYTRPLKDAVKESIFNILLHSNLLNIDINSANILDLYSGFGSFGIECISRGAKKVVFIEKDKNTSEILLNNLVKLSIDDKAQIFNDNIENILKQKQFEKFSIIFFDPPFNKNDFIKNLKLIRAKKMYKANHVVILHRDIKSQDKLNDLIKVINIKIYGRSKIIFGFIN